MSSDKITKKQIPSKISKLRKEGYPQKQAVAISLSMAGQARENNKKEAGRAK